MPYDALIDSSSKALLALSPYPPVIALLNEWVLDTMHANGVNHPNYMREPRFKASALSLALSNPSNTAQWSWHFETRTLRPTPQRLLTEELHKNARLLSAKARVLENMMRDLSFVRLRVGSGVALQESVYMAKRLQALAFKASEYDEETLIEYPLVVQYADLRDIPLKQAADDILFKAKLADDYLSKTEVLRMKYFSLVRDETDVNALSAIQEKFVRDCYVPQVT